MLSGAAATTPSFSKKVKTTWRPCTTDWKLTRIAGSSSQCMPCRHSDDQHQRRHREIAELVHKLALLNPTATTSIDISPPTPRTLGAIPQDLDENTTPKTTKKERKAAKKARKISAMPKALNAATIDHVARVLHPDDHDLDDEELEHQLLNDPDIKDNRFFHKGTSNVRELRNIFVKKDRKGGAVTFRVEPEEMDGLLQLLDVKPNTASTSPEEKRIVDELKTKIERDLIQAQEENEGFMMRKAGFWRWASRKAYNRLVANGRIWEDKSEGSQGAKNDGSAESGEGDGVSSDHSGDATDDTNITEPDTDGVAGVADGVKKLDVSTSMTPLTPKTDRTDDGWTSVSKPKAKGGKTTKKAAAPKMTVKMSGNGGLAKMVQSSTPRRTGFLRYHEEDD